MLRVYVSKNGGLNNLMQGCRVSKGDKKEKEKLISVVRDIEKLSPPMELHCRLSPTVDLEDYWILSQSGGYNRKSGKRFVWVLSKDRKKALFLDFVKEHEPPHNAAYDQLREKAKNITDADFDKAQELSSEQLCAQFHVNNLVQADVPEKQTLIQYFIKDVEKENRGEGGPGIAFLVRDVDKLYKVIGELIEKHLKELVNKNQITQKELRELAKVLPSRRAKKYFWKYIPESLRLGKNRGNPGK